MTEGEYARNGLRMAGVEDEIFDLLDGFTDFERLGRSMMEEDGVQATSFGSIKRLSAPFPHKPELGQKIYLKRLIPTQILIKIRGGMTQWS